MKELEKKLAYKLENGWKDANKEEVFSFCEEYKDFLDKCKTERETTEYIEKKVREKGFLPFGEAVKKGVKAGDKLYILNKNKNIMLIVVGKDELKNGANIIAAHIDAPRLDLKQNPLYEEMEIAELKTHYYGGIKKYQWTAMPLALHGVIIDSENRRINITIGEDENDPVFCITDLLPHLARTQMSKTMSEGIQGEDLSLLCGSIPLQLEDNQNGDGDKPKKHSVKDKVKLNILKILNEKYNITEEDFTSSEIEIVPAFKAKDIGFDRSMVGAYGQDDRVCSFTAYKAITEIENPEKTAVCLLVDKEEIGSMGNTGMQSNFFKIYMDILCNELSEQKSHLLVSEMFRNSKCLSADVHPGVDPKFKTVQDLKNATYFNKGVAISKYGGARGKAGSSDANAEFMGYVRNLFNSNNVKWQTGELGKVDMGGGGTVAQFLANEGIEVIDCGVSIFSMHSPFEISSKLDIFMSFRAYNVFYKGI